MYGLCHPLTSVRITYNLFPVSLLQSPTVFLPFFCFSTFSPSSHFICRSRFYLFLCLILLPLASFLLVASCFPLSLSLPITFSSLPLPFSSPKPSSLIGFVFLLACLPLLCLASSFGLSPSLQVRCRLQKPFYCPVFPSVGLLPGRLQRKLRPVSLILNQSGLFML